MRRLGELELYGMRGNANSADRYPLVERHSSQVEGSWNFQLVPILFQLDMDRSPSVQVFVLSIWNFQHDRAK